MVVSVEPFCMDCPGHAGSMASVCHILIALPKCLNNKVAELLPWNVVFTEN